MKTDNEFKGKRVLVTGGARGLGEAVVRHFVKLEACVFALDREVELLKELKKNLPQVTTIALDLQDWNSTKQTIQSIAPIHHLVNNAGISGDCSLLDVDEESVNRILDVNFKSVLNVSRVVVQGLIDTKAEGGTIVNVSSVLAHKPQAYGSVYCSTKVAVRMLTKCMALEFGEYNVRVNCISPTIMATGIVPDPGLMQLMLENVVKKQIIKKELKTSEAAELIVFLLSKKSAMITAEDIVIDGGWLSKL